MRLKGFTFYLYTGVRVTTDRCTIALNEVGFWNPQPRQIEFLRLNITNMLMSQEAC